MPFDEDLFISLVEKYRVLWDRKHLYYTKTTRKNKCWKELVLEMNNVISVHEAKEKWKIIRRGVSRAVQITLSKGTLSSSKYQLSPSLQFMWNNEIEQKTKIECPEENSYASSDEPLSSSASLLRNALCSERIKTEERWEPEMNNKIECPEENSYASSDEPLSSSAPLLHNALCSERIKEERWEPEITGVTSQDSSSVNERFADFMRENILAALNRAQDIDEQLELQNEFILQMNEIIRRKRRRKSNDS